MAQLMTKKGLYLMIQPLSDKRFFLHDVKAKITASLLPCPENKAYIDALCRPSIPSAVQQQRLTALSCFLSLVQEIIPSALPSLRLHRNEYGRPYAHTEEPLMSAFDFNLTHSKSYAGCALLLGEGQVGLDIEDAIPSPKAEIIASRFFSEAELQYLRGLPKEADPSLEISYLWTAKEALAKQDGRGFPLQHDSLALRAEVSLMQGILQETDKACPPSVLTVCIPAGCPSPVYSAASLPVLWKNSQPQWGSS